MPPKGSKQPAAKRAAKSVEPDHPSGDESLSPAAPAAAPAATEHAPAASTTPALPLQRFSSSRTLFQATITEPTSHLVNAQAFSPSLLLSQLLSSTICALLSRDPTFNSSTIR